MTKTKNACTEANSVQAFFMLPRRLQAANPLLLIFSEIG